jgi:hypothetical protein
VDKKAERVLSLLSESIIERTRNCIQINFGGQDGIVILVTPEAIEFRLSTVE